MKGSLRPANRAIGQRKVVLRDTDAIATSLKLDDAMKSRVQRLATTRDHSAHLLMREKARESFKAEANASWAAYKETRSSYHWGRNRRLAQ